MNAVNTETPTLIVPEALNKAALDLAQSVVAESASTGKAFLKLAAACKKHAADSLDRAGSYFKGACAYAEDTIRKQWIAAQGLDKEGKAVKAPRFSQIAPSWAVYKSNIVSLFEAGKDPSAYETMGQVALAVKAVRQARNEGQTQTSDTVQIKVKASEPLQAALAAFIKSATALTDKAQAEVAGWLVELTKATDYLNSTKDTDAVPTVRVEVPEVTQSQTAKAAKMRGGSK